MARQGERNAYEQILTKAANPAAGTYYYPGPLVGDPGIDHSGYRDASWFISATNAGGVTQTFTVEISDDGTTWIDVTRAAYDCVSDTGPGSATWVAAAGVTTNFKLDFDGLNARYIRLVNVVVGAANNSAVVSYRDSGVV